MMQELQKVKLDFEFQLKPELGFEMKLESLEWAERSSLLIYQQRSYSAKLRGEIPSWGVSVKQIKC